jgi:hypothetical protein
VLPRLSPHCGDNWGSTHFKILIPVKDALNTRRCAASSGEPRASRASGSIACSVATPRCPVMFERRFEQVPRSGAKGSRRPLGSGADPIRSRRETLENLTDAGGGFRYGHEPGRRARRAPHVERDLRALSQPLVSPCPDIAWVNDTDFEFAGAELIATFADAKRRRRQ